MSLSGVLQVALTGLQTSTAVAQVISGNVSNAQTPGYTEKTAVIEPTYTGDAAGGVEIVSYSRLTDSVLSATSNNATSTASYLSTQNGYMTQIQSILDSQNDPPALSSALSNFQTAWTTYSTAPESSVNQQTLIAAGETLATTVSTIQTQASQLQSQVQGDLSATVTTLNGDLQTIQNLNNQIGTALASGQSAVDLEDQRDVAVTSVASMMNVQVLSRANGAIALYTPAGVGLVDGVAQSFTASGDNILNAAGANVNSQLTGGILQAQTDMLSTSTTGGNGVGVFAKLQSQLQNFVNMFVSPATTTGSSPTTGGFAYTYNNATTNASNNELASGFFTASVDTTAGSPNYGLPDVTTFAVNSALVNGTSNVKEAAGAVIPATFTATNLAINNSAYPTVSTTNNFTAGGISVTNQTYGEISASILSSFQQAANAIQTSSTSATAQETYYKNTLSSETGVNTDTELVNLTNWQNAYAASAHVISTVQQMMTTLENMVT